MNMIGSLTKRGIQKLIHSTGHEIVSRQIQPSSSEDPDPLRFVHPDMEAPFPDFYLQCREYTMTSVERLYALFQAIHYIEQRRILGSFVECGVWRGGSSMMAALTLQESRSTDRDLYLYDTYQGMSAPTARDEKADGSVDASAKYQALKNGETVDWCYAPFEDVRSNLRSTGYPSQKTHFIKGMVEESLQDQPPEGPIAILRLDTDFYESTKCELEHLYPRLATGGILIIDDYGTWKGSKAAVDEYFADSTNRPLLNKIDGTGRIAIKVD